MSCSKGVVIALDAAREAGDATPLAKPRHAGTPACQNLVGIGLMTDVPYQTIVGSVEHVVQRDGQLDGAEIRR